MSDKSPHASTDNAHPDLAVLAGGVAVITGGASGIGYALAEKAASHGMHPVLADIEQGAIDKALLKIRPLADSVGVKPFGFQVDVSSGDNVNALARAVAAQFPDTPVSLLCCNAGVGGGGAVLTATDIDWDFVLGVNVKGVAHCIRAFVPGMLTQQAPGAVVTTASQDGLCAAQGIYGVSKHACVALTEALHGEVGGHLSVHVLCPNIVSTNIVTSERNRPQRFGGQPRVAGANEPSPANVIADRFKAFGMPPSRCADQVFDAIQSGVFYVLAEAEDDPGYVRLEAETRMNAILNGGRPFRPRSELISKVFNPRVPIPEKDRGEN